jgi:hypothetical protein
MGKIKDNIVRENYPFFSRDRVSFLRESTNTIHTLYINSLGIVPLYLIYSGINVTLLSASILGTGGLANIFCPVIAFKMTAAINTMVSAFSLNRVFNKSLSYSAYDAMSEGLFTLVSSAMTRGQMIDDFYEVGSFTDFLRVLAGNTVLIVGEILAEAIVSGGTNYLSNIVAPQLIKYFDLPTKLLSVIDKGSDLFLLSSSLSHCVSYKNHIFEEYKIHELLISNEDDLKMMVSPESQSKEWLEQEKARAAKEVFVC